MERVGIIGLGNISERHRRNIRQCFPKAIIVVMSSRNDSKQSLTTIDNADIIVSSIEEMLEQRIQYVIIASPASHHLVHTQAFLEAHVPVLIEKPLAATLKEGRQLAKLASETPTHVAVGYCLRFLSSTEVVKNILQQGTLGRLYNIQIEVGQYLPQWRPGKDYRNSVSAQKKLGGGVLLELSHELDLAHWLLGPLTLQHAILRSEPELETDVEDCADITLLTHNQAVAHIHLDFLQHVPRRTWRIIGSQGTLEWDLVRNEVIISSDASTEVLYSAPDWDKNQMYLRQFEDFITPQPDASQRIIASVDEALTSLELVDEIKRYPVHTLHN